MRHRTPRILLLLLVTVWYAALLPGHRRGVIQLSGATPAGSHDACCEENKPHRPGDPVPARSPTNCAVCKYMGALTIAPPPELGIAPLGPTDRQPAPLEPSVVRVRSLRTYLGRAPPAV